MSSTSPQLNRHRPAGRWRRLVAVLATLLSVLIVATSTAGWALLHRVEGQVDRVDVFADLSHRPQASNGGTNFLLVGSDTREGISRRALRRLTAGSRRSAAGFLRLPLRPINSLRSHVKELTCSLNATKAILPANSLLYGLRARMPPVFSSVSVMINGAVRLRSKPKTSSL